MSNRKLLTVTEGFLYAPLYINTYIDTVFNDQPNEQYLLLKLDCLF